jgi:hypothetical protein
MWNIDENQGFTAVVGCLTSKQVPRTREKADGSAILAFKMENDF